MDVEFNDEIVNNKNDILKSRLIYSYEMFEQTIWFYTTLLQGKYIFEYEIWDRFD